MKREFRSSRKLFKTLSLDESSSPEFDLYSDLEEHFEEVAETMAETMEEYIFPYVLHWSRECWLRNKPSGLIKTWEDLKAIFLSKYCPPARTAKKIEEINNFQQEPDETLCRAWERFKELLMKCPQHYLTDIQEVILFYNGLEVPTRQILDSKGAIPTKTAVDAKVGCELCKEPHYTKDYPLKEEGKTLEEAYYTQFGVPFQQGGQYRAAALGFYQRNNANPSYQERR
ncbi:gypsy/ty3 retroelement polyprotein [Tanacetum coccineum]